VTSGWRPEGYNKLIGGALNSAHIEGKACDFVVTGIDCDDVREQLEPKLTELGIRMEDLPGANWVHIDIRKPLNEDSNRFFKP